MAGHDGFVDIYGKTSPQYKESTTQAALDFEGIAIHCAAGNALCTSTGSSPCAQTITGGIMGYDGVCAEPDNLPQEPTGYSGYMGLFGHIYVAGAICPTCPVTNGRPTVYDLNGNLMSGFPGFGPISPAQALGYVAQMLENNVPIVYAYISDAHDCHTALPTCTLTDGYFRALGPGEAPYETQLQAYNAAFGAFFSRLANDGITPANTLFIIGADEQDHFVGGPASPAGCDGVTTPCTYSYPTGYTPVGNDSPSGYNFSIGEVQADLTQLYQQQFPGLIPTTSSDSTGANSGLNAATSSSLEGIFDYHYDMAPAVSFNPYLATNTASFIRQMERATAQLTGANPITGNTDQLTNYLIDGAGLNALHMITADPNRTPNFVMFANPDWYFQEQAQGTVIEQAQDYAYNHGGVAPEINTTWTSFVGPGVANNGVDSTTWTDETDIRPTIMYLAGLTDDYQSDGRVVVEDLVPAVLPPSLNVQTFEQLAAAYKQMNAPIGAFGQAVLQSSTVALASGSPSNDSQYTAYESLLNQLTAQRNTLAPQIKSQLNAVEFQGATLAPATANSLSGQANSLTLQLTASPGLQAAIAGSSAFWLEAGEAAYTLGGTTTTCAWTNSSPLGGFVLDQRNLPSPFLSQDNGNLWVTWTPGTAGGTCANPDSTSQVWAYISVDAVVGLRCFFAQPQCTLNTAAGAGTAGANLLPGITDTALPASVLSAFNGVAISMAASDILPVDAKFATYSTLADCGPLSFGTQFSGLGYNLGVPQVMSAYFASEYLNVNDFNVYGNDPVSGSAVPAYTITPVGAMPVVIAMNTSNSNGFGSPNITNLSRANLTGLFTSFLGRTADALSQPFAGTGATYYGATTLIETPLSGTYNIFEHSIPNNKEFYRTQEVNNCDPYSAPTNPLIGSRSIGSTTSYRYRVLGTSEMVSEIQSVKDSVGYALWSAENFAGVTNMKYVTVDGVDPIQNTYTGGTLPPTLSNVTMSHVADGTYPIWNEERLITYSSGASAAALLNSYLQGQISFGAGATHPEFIPDSQLNVFHAHFAPALPAGINFNATNTAADGPKVCGAGSNPEDGGDVGGIVLSLQAGGDFCVMKGNYGAPGGVGPTDTASFGVRQ